jgi:hypothetical protein
VEGQELAEVCWDKVMGIGQSEPELSVIDSESEKFLLSSRSCENVGRCM